MGNALKLKQLRIPILLLLITIITLSVLFLNYGATQGYEPNITRIEESISIKKINPTTLANAAKPVKTPTPPPNSNKTPPKNQLHLKIGSKERVKIGKWIPSKSRLKPQAQLPRWNGEANINITHQNPPPVNPKILPNKIIWKGRNRQIQIYPLQKRTRTTTINSTQHNFTQLQNGGLEYEVILNKKPSSNKVKFNINTKNLSFHYQPPLHPDHPTWADTDNDGKPDTFRPENVVDSYAAYHDSKRGGNYGTGKAFHIYRPKIIDIDGNTTWGDLSINESTGSLTITVNQTWLNNATYPVTVDPTLGYETVGGTKQNDVGDEIRGSWFTMPENGQVNNISVYMYTYAGSYDHSTGIYWKSNGSLVVNGSCETPSGSGWTEKWYTFSINTKPNITKGTDYWLTTWDSYQYTDYFYDSGSAKGGMSSNTLSCPPSFPNPWNPTSEDKIYSIYASYTAFKNVSVITNPATSIGSTSSTLNGNLSALHVASANASFQWRLQIGNGEANWTTQTDWQNGALNSTDVNASPGDVKLETDQTSNEAKSFGSPSTAPRGLAWDGQYLWHADSDSDLIYKLDTDGNVQKSFSSPGGDPEGLTHDGTNLWHTDWGDAKIFKLDTDGNEIKNFSSPAPEPSGITWDGSNLWVTSINTKKIYKIDTDGNEIKNFSAPDTPAGLTWDGQYLWVVVRNGVNDIAKLDTDGNQLDSYNTPGGWGKGLTWDGEFHWHADWGDDKVYKLGEYLSTGNHTTENHDYGAEVTLNTLRANASILTNTGIDATIYDHSGGSVTVTLNDGNQTYDVSGLSPTNTARVRTDFTTSNVSRGPALHSLTLERWNATANQTLTATGTYNDTLTGLTTGTTYEFRAKAEGDTDTDHGTILNFTTTSGSTVVSISLSNKPIQFGALDPGVQNASAQVGSGFPLNVTIKNSTNVDVNVTLKSDDFTNTSSGSSFGITNLTYSSRSEDTWTVTSQSGWEDGTMTNVTADIPGDLRLSLRDSFESDSAGTSFGNITNWDYFSEAGRSSTYSTPAGENASVVDTYYFNGSQATHMAIKADNQGDCQEGKRKGRQFLIANDNESLSAPSDYVTFWATGFNWDTPSRYQFTVSYVFNNGTFTDFYNHGGPDAKEDVFQRRWDNDPGDDFDYADESRIGADGRTWKRYTVKIPNSITKSNMTFAIRLYYDTWDCNSGWGEVRIDDAYYSDASGARATTGTYTSQWHDWGKSMEHDTLFVNSTLKGETVNYTAQTSDDGSTQKDSITGTLSGEDESILITSLKPGRYLRVQRNLSTTDNYTTPIIHDYTAKTTSSSNVSQATTTYRSPPASPNWINIPAPSSDVVRSIYFWLTTPIGQSAGTYESNVTVKAYENSTVP